MIPLRLLASGLAILALAGCAHSIDIEPDLGKIGPTSSARIAAKVGYHVPPEMLNIEITTPGGGGDNVRYNPYAAMSSGYRMMLSNVFERVVPIASLSDLHSEAGASLDYVAIPTVITNSGGSNVFTWPPENFTVDLTTTLRNREGNIVASPRVVGIGTATTGERLSDQGFSGRRALEDALRKMELALREWGSAGKPASSGGAQSMPGISDRIRQLKDLFDSKMITEREYEIKRKAILDEL